MKKGLTILTVLLTLATGAGAAAQNHRHHPQTELVDSTNKNTVEVYSDTTSADQSAVVTHTSGGKLGGRTTTIEFDTDDFSQSTMNQIFSQLDGGDIANMLFILGILLIIFVLAPVLIIVALFYFINKNRKQRLQLAQMAMQQGQPIPQQLLDDKTVGDDADEYQKGMRQCFVGVGLMIFLGYAAGNVGFGVGALVFCIGLGKVFASRAAQKTKERME